MEGNCIAFKLNYCNGLEVDDNQNEHIGFRGLCSKNVMDYNVKVAKRGWCSHKENLCRQFLDKKILPEELDRKWKQADKEDCPGTCNESFALKYWYAEAGWVDNPWRPCRIDRKDLTNHLCILTTVKPYMPDSSRFVLAMFIIKDFFEGDKKNPGKVSACNYWRLEFRPNETNEMNFWDIYPGKPPWRQGLFRYFDDATAIKFLERAVKVKRGTPEEDFAKEFLKQYQYK